MKNFIKYVLKVLENKLNSLIIFNALFAGSLLIVSGCLYEHLGMVFALSFFIIWLLAVLVFACGLVISLFPKLRNKF